MTLLEQIAQDTGLLVEELNGIVLNAPYRYKEYEIDKRSGGKRRIAQPAREVKRIQRAIMSLMLSKFNVHNSAKAYVRGRGILKNAQPHSKNRYILKLDFENFFNSIVPTDFVRLCKANASQYDDKTMFSLIQCLFWQDKTANRLCLSVGAPSSPMISNAILFQYDSSLDLFCRQRNLVYTRYADDITVSGNNMNKIKSARAFAKKVVRETASPKLKYKHQKEIIVTKSSRRVVTGLVITNDALVSIGRDRKRLISAMVHRILFDKDDKPSLATVRGMLAFVNACEPSFLERLKKKYGKQNIERIIRIK